MITASNLSRSMWRNNFVECFGFVSWFFTEEAVLGYVPVDAPQVTSWLEVSSVGVEVIMCHGLFDAHAEAHTLTGEGVDGVHKIGIVGRQSVGGRHALKQRPRWIQTWVDAERELGAVPQKKEKCRRLILITCNPSNFLWTFQVTPSKAGDVRPKAVADQVNVFKRVLIVNLLELHVVLIHANAQVSESVLCTDTA